MYVCKSFCHLFAQLMKAIKCIRSELFACHYSMPQQPQPKPLASKQKWYYTPTMTYNNNGVYYRFSDRDGLKAVAILTE